MNENPNYEALKNMSDGEFRIWTATRFEKLEMKFKALEGAVKSRTTLITALLLTVLAAILGGRFL